MVLVLFLAGSLLAQDQARSANGQPVGSMKELMSQIILPTSNAVLYITRQTPEDEEGWKRLQMETLMLAESANLLLMPSRARDQDQWTKDTQLLLDAGRAAYKAALAKDVDGLSELNDALYTSCVQCHEDYGVTPGAQ